MRPSGFASEERVSQEDFLGRVSKTAADTRSPSGPVGAGASKKPGAFRLSFDWSRCLVG